MPDDGHFGERVAARYDDSAPEMFAPEAVDPVADLLAGFAGMSLRDRWGGWQGEPFTDESRSHVSIWEKPRG